MDRTICEIAVQRVQTRDILDLRPPVGRAPCLPISTRDGDVNRNWTQSQTQSSPFIRRLVHHIVSRTHSQGPEDPAFAMGQYPHQGTLNNKPQRRSSSVLGHPAGHPQPQTPRLNASGTATGGVGGPGPTPRRATTPGAGGVITPGSNFDASEVDSEDFLRSQLMRSASDEALGLKSDDLEDDVDSLRSPFYKPRSSHLRGYPLESPQSPHSEDSSYQGSIPGSGPSDRSYNGGGGGSNGSATAAGRQPAGGASGGGGLGAGPDDLEAEAMTRAGYYLPDYKH